MGKLKAFFLAAVILLFLSSAASASVEWQVQKELNIGETPIDLAISSDGKRTFVLTKKGDIQIYSANGSLIEKISVGRSFDGIDVSPKGDKLYLSSGKDKSVQIVSLDFIMEINSVGSPYKGPADARVVVAVFSDFQ